MAVHQHCAQTLASCSKRLEVVISAKVYVNFFFLSLKNFFFAKISKTYFTLSLCGIVCRFEENNEFDTLWNKAVTTKCGKRKAL